MDVTPSGSPPESSISMSKRTSSADTRRAIVRSGVINAAVRLGVSNARRMNSAKVKASKRSSVASIRLTPSSALEKVAPRVARYSRQCSVLSAGRNACAANSRRAASGGVGTPISRVSARLMFMIRERRFRMDCGCVYEGSPCSPEASPIWRQAISSRSRSRPGRTTAPCVMREIASRSWAVVGLEPVDPSAMTGSPSLALFKCSICAARSAF